MHQVLTLMIPYIVSDHRAGVKVGRSFLMAEHGGTISIYSFKYKQQDEHCKIFFITVSALRVSGCFSAHHQELKTVHTASGICQASLTYTRCCVYSFELLMMGGETS